MENLTVCFYSKFSPHCKTFLNLLQEIDHFVKKICVDNYQVRDRILKNSKISIQKVPCILIIKPNGIIEKYEGNDAFEWINQIFSSKQSQMLQQKDVSLPENLFPEENVENVENVQNVENVEIKTEIKESESSIATSIDNLIFEEDSEIITTNKSLGKKDFETDSLSSIIEEREEPKLLNTAGNSILENAKRMQEIRDREVPADEK